MKWPELARMVDAQAEDPFRMIKREFLGNMPAHGKTHHVGGLDAGVVEHVGGVVCHIGQRVARRRHARPADAAIVENDRAKLWRKIWQLPGPEAEVMAGAADQKKGGAIAMALVLKGDPIARFRYRHIWYPMASRFTAPL